MFLFLLSIAVIIVVLIVVILIHERNKGIKSQYIKSQLLFTIYIFANNDLYIYI